MIDSPLLIGSRFKKDPLVTKAKELLLEALSNPDYKLKNVRPPQKALISSYEETITTFNQLRGGNLYFPYLGSGWGSGPFVELLDGSVKYDMINGIGPHFWGHSFAPLMEVAINAALSDTIMQGHLQQNQDACQISELLTKASKLDHCFLSSSGAMANENALKIAFQNKAPAHRILAFEHCFMGRTLALSQITDKPSFREGLPATVSVDYIPFYSSDEGEKSIERTINVLHQHLARYPGQHAVMCFELIQGEGGFHRGTHEFFSSVMKILKEHNILIFIDEIQTFGRTPQLFAYQYFQIDQFVDLVSIGKLSQVCATLFRKELKPKLGLLSQTFTSSTVALQTGTWIIQHLLSDHFYGNDGKLVQLHQRFEEHFQRLHNQWPDRIRGPYGIGAMVIFTPFDGEAKRVAQFVQDLFQEGVISFIAGSHPTRVRFLIPGGILTLNDVDGVMEIVERVLSKG